MPLHRAAPAAESAFAPDANNALPPPAKRLLVTSALPYANGSAHLGHLVEYILTDIYVRAQRALGIDAHFIWSNDAHGTPIELNARKLGLTPEALVKKFHQEQLADFARFGIAPAIFTSTHDEANRSLVNDIFATLRAKGCIEEREMEGNFCPQDQRFLPDRFVKGTCPKCAAAEQYGDVCEKCGSTYAPTDLKEAQCVLCGTPPVRRPSKHAFYRLSRPETVAFLREWTVSGTLQQDVANFVGSWLDQGLKDWCITRDGPYFGFAVPDMPGKFFYVWLDAPIGYMSASLQWGSRHGLGLNELWRSADTRIEHVIGKDIMYFHTLFWPAVLRDAGYSLPSKVHVHGMLTVDGEKMSKSRGTFINARTFAEHIEPEALRFYNATKYTPESRDMDLSFADFVLRVNGELVNKHVNLFSRLARFVHSRLGGQLPALPYSAQEAQAPAQQQAAPEATPWLTLARKTVALGRRIEQAYRGRDIALATRLAAEMADGANEAMQTLAPWALIAHDRDGAAVGCATIAAVADAVIMYLAPIVPIIAGKAAATFDTVAEPMDHRRLFARGARTLAPFDRLFDRVDRAMCERVVAASAEGRPEGAAKPHEAQPPRDESAAAPPAAQAATTSKKQTEAAGAPQPAGTAELTAQQLQAVRLVVGTVLAAQVVAKSRKLLQLSIDLGEAAPRQILAGIKERYAPEDLVGTQVVVVANLRPATIMGLQSQGMVLASDDENGQPNLLRPDRPQPPGAPVH